MIVVDTSVWIGHLRAASRALEKCLADRRVLMHPMVLGELACGTLADRPQRLASWRRLPKIDAQPHDDVIDWIGAERVMGRGVGFVDAHLLYATVQQPGSRLWTLDKRLGRLAATFQVSHSLS